MTRLYLDDVRNPPDDGGGPWTTCRTAEEAKAVLLAGSVAEATLDHDLGHCPLCEVVSPDDEQVYALDCIVCVHLRTGYDLVRWMAESRTWPATKPRVHSANPVGRAAMVQAIERHWCASDSDAEPVATGRALEAEEPLGPECQLGSGCCGRGYQFEAVAGTKNDWIPDMREVYCACPAGYRLRMLDGRDGGDD